MRQGTAGCSTCGGVGVQAVASQSSIASRADALSSSGAPEPSIDARAIDASASSSSPISVRASSYSVEQTGPEQQRVVAVEAALDPGLEQLGERVLGERRVHRQQQVRGRAHVEHDVGVGEPLHQLGVLDRPHAVLEPVGREGVERAPHRLGPGQLAGVRRREEPGLLGDGERLGVGLGRPDRLVVGEPERDHAARRPGAAAIRAWSTAIAGSTVRSAATITPDADARAARPRRRRRRAPCR